MTRDTRQDDLTRISVAPEWVWRFGLVSARDKCILITTQYVDYPFFIMKFYTGVKNTPAGLYDLLQHAN